MTTSALTAADYVVLQQYADAGQRELYWQYLELKGDIYAQRAGEVVRNDSLSAQIANQHAESYAPAGFGGDARWDDFGIKLMQKDLVARKSSRDNGSIDGGLTLSVDAIRTYHADNFREFGMSQSAWTLEAVIGPLIDSGDPADMATAQRIWNDAMGHGLDYFIAGLESIGYSLADKNLAWVAETGVFAINYDPYNITVNPDYIRGWMYDASIGQWVRAVSDPSVGTLLVKATAEQAAQLDKDRQARIARNNDKERFTKAPTDNISPPVYNLIPKSPIKVGTVPNGTVDQIKKFYTTATQTVSPLVLDLNGDGIKTTSLSTSSTYFDFDANGHAQRTGWVDKNDGLLVLDRNNNGTIDNGLELFGNNTKLTNGSTATDGFAALAELDSNNDGKIDNLDVQYNNLRIWQDSNSNGITDTGELITLATAGVKSLNVNYNNTATSNNGNTDQQQGQYTKTDGTTGQMNDIWFAQDTARTVDQTVTATISNEIKALPNIAGFGNVSDLQTAMAKDPALTALVQSYHAAANNGATINDLQTRATAILNQWTGASAYAPNSRGDYITDARHVYALEAFMGQGFIQYAGINAGTPNPGPNATAQLEQAYAKLYDYINDSLLAQTVNKPLFDSINYTWNSSTNSIDINVSQTLSMLNSKYTTNPEQGAASMAAFGSELAGQGSMGQAVLEQLRAAGNTAGSDYQLLLATLGLGTALVGTANAETLNGMVGNDVLFGNAGNDTLNGNDGNDRIYGGDGNDTIDGGKGDDVMDGGAGNDVYYIDIGNDRYVFGRGSGQDSWVNYSSASNSARTLYDTIMLKNDITPNDLTLRRSSNSLIIGINGTTDTLTLQNYFNDTMAVSAGLGLVDIQFANGTVWQLHDVQTRVLVATSGNDTLYGIDGFNENINGGNGDDRIDAGSYFGSADTDILDGGTGNDTLWGGYGSDVYRFGRGYGNDTIYQTEDSLSDTIELGVGITVTDIALRRSSGDGLIISIAGTNDTLTISNYFKSDDISISNLNTIKFIDGTTWTINDIKNRVQTASTGDDYILGYAGNDSLVGGDGNDTMSGKDGNDIISGGNGNDTISGGNGDDMIEGGEGNDIINAGKGRNTVLFSRGSGKDVVTFEDNVRANGGMYVDQNHIVFGAGITAADLTFSITGDRVLDNNLTIQINGTNGADILTISNYFANWSELYGSALLQFADGSVLSYAQVYKLLPVTETAVVRGSAGNDTLASGSTDTTNNLSAVVAGDGNDILNGDARNDQLFGEAGDDALNGNVGNDLLYGGTGADTMTGGAGNDIYAVDNLADQVIENLNEGTDTVQSTMDYTLGANVENLEIFGIAIKATGNSGNNEIGGNDSDNIINGGAGVDNMYGGKGNDTYYRDNWFNSGAFKETIIENPDEGVDTVISSVDYDNYYLDDNVENLTVTGTVIAARGNTLNNVIKGNANNNYIDGKSGVDSMIGGAGDDTYVVDNTGDNIIENLSEGTDTVQTSVSYTLAANIESLTLTGTDAINGMGNVLDNIIKGNSAKNTLTGGAGNDTYYIDTGNYSYDVGADDTVIENANEGIDTVYSMGSYTLGANLENLVLSSGDGAGNDLANVITGSSGDNMLSGGAGNDKLDAGSGDDVLDGGVGNDTLTGGSGNDVYVVDSSSDVVIETGYDSKDAVQASVTYSLANLSAVENLTLAGLANISGTGNSSSNVMVGNAGDNTLDAGAGSDVLDGGAGNDTLLGGAGNDTLTGGLGNDSLQGGLDKDIYIFAKGFGQDVIVDNGSAYSTSVYYVDEVQFAADLKASDFVLSRTGDDLLMSVKNSTDKLTIQGYFAANGQGVNAIEQIKFADGRAWDYAAVTAIIQAGGTSVDTLIFGASGDDTLNGAIDADTINGGAGNDTIYGNGGNDLVNGGDGSDTIDGGGGRDTMSGGLGSDVYVVDNIADVVLENTNEGTDTVNSNVNYTLSNNVENLNLTGTNNINGVGNALNNNMTGNAADNVIDGGVGADNMSGGAGNDTYTVDNASDSVSESSGNGRDTVRTNISYVLGNNLEDLELLGVAAIDGAGNALDNFIVGNSANNKLTGNAGNDTLIGAGGADILVGGAGDDVYEVDSLDDVVTEAVNEGTDTIQSKISIAALLANVENATLLGADSLNVKGNASNNVLLGNNGNNLLDGDAGLDTLKGGAGDDVYVVDNVGDVVVENVGEGLDTIQTNMTYALSGYVENIILTGVAAINATGNDLDNRLMGNSASNTLLGGVGNDVLVGGLASDVLNGGDGNDVYVFKLGDGLDTVIDNDSTVANIDCIQIEVSSSNATLNRSGQDLVIQYSALDSITVQNYFENAASQIEQIKFTNNVTWTPIDVANIINPPANHAPVVDVAIANQAATQGQAFSFVIPSDAFKDIDVGDALSYGVTQADGAALPSWLTFDATTRTLSGTPTYTDIGSLDFKVNVTDKAGESASTIFGLSVEAIILNSTVNYSTLMIDHFYADEDSHIIYGAGSAGDGYSVMSGDVGNNDYTFGRDSGRWILAEYDSDPANVDSVSFQGVTANQLWFEHVGNHLKISVIGTSDELIIGNWYLGSEYHMEILQTADGSALLSTQVDALVAAMAAFTPPAAGQTSLPANYQSALNPVMAANWH